MKNASMSNFTCKKSVLVNTDCTLEYLQVKKTTLVSLISTDYKVAHNTCPFTFFAMTVFECTSPIL